jgi:hypothetical protein
VVRQSLAVALLAAAVTLGAGGARAGGILGPTSIAVGFGSVWVGMGDGDVLRLDTHTGQRQARLRGGSTAFVHGLVATPTAVWTVRGRVARIDPRTNGVREVRRVGSATLFAIAATNHGIWVVDDGANEVLRIAPARLALLGRIRIPGRAAGLATGTHVTFVVTSRTRGPLIGPSGSWLIRRIDPSANRLSAPLVRLGCYPSIAIGAAAVWTTDECQGSLTRRNPRTLASTGMLSVPPAHWVPVVGFGSLWLIGPLAVIRIDPKNLRVVATIRRASGLAAAIGAGGVWVVDAGDGVRGSVRKIDPQTNRVTKVFEVDARQ